MLNDIKRLNLEKSAFVAQTKARRVKVDMIDYELIR